MTINVRDARLLSFGQANKPFVPGANPNIVDSQQVLPDEIWFVDSCSAYFESSNAADNINPGPSGILLCPAGTTTPNSNLASDEIPAGAIQLPMDSGGGFWVGASFAFPRVVALHVVRDFIMPPGSFLRFVADTAAGGPAGTGQISLVFSFTKRKICDLDVNCP